MRIDYRFVVVVVVVVVAVVVVVVVVVDVFDLNPISITDVYSESKNPSQLLPSSLMSFCSRNCLKQQKQNCFVHSQEIGYFAEAITRVCISFTFLRKCHDILHLIFYQHRRDSFFDTEFVCQLS